MIDEASQFAVGDVIAGRYRIEREIAKGGAGIVYAARVLSAGESIALKVDRHDRDPRQFAREVDVLRSLEHPNIVRIIETGATGLGHAYIAMELLDGETLRARIDRAGPMKVGAALHTILPIVAALATAHRQEIVHRDVKPSNIFLVAGGAPKLLDFGLGKSLANADHQLTAAAGFSGTPAYMAPELITRKVSSPAVDVYAVGLVLLEMLTGEPVFQGATPADIAFAQIRDEVVIPPSLASLELGEVLRRSIAKDASDRFDDAAQLLAALSNVRDDPQQLVDLPTLTGVQLLNTLSGAAMASDLDDAKTEDGGTSKFARGIRRSLPPPPRERFASTNQIAAVLVAIGLLVIVGVGVYQRWPDPTAEGQIRSTAVNTLLTVPDSGGSKPDAAARMLDASEPDAAHELTDDAGRPTPQPALPSRGCKLPDAETRDPAPLIVLLHPQHVDPQTFLAKSGFQELAAEHRFEVVAPKSPRGPEVRYLWSRPRVARAAPILTELGREAGLRLTGPVTEVNLAVREAGRTRCIDLARVYVVGWAEAGAGAERFTCHQLTHDPPIVWARAVATVGHRGSGPKFPCEGATPAIPLIRFNGRDSGEVIFAGQLDCDRLPSPHTLNSVDEAWAASYGCTSDPAPFVPDGGPDERSWECPSGPFVSRLLEGGRGWPNIQRKSTDGSNLCDGPRTRYPYARWIWEFFEQVGGTKPATD